jgi:hypothetical protein
MSPSACAAGGSQRKSYRTFLRQAIDKGFVTPELEQARREQVPTFTHFLDLPILFVIVALGAMRPETWSAIAISIGIAVLVATGFSVVLPKLYPWQPSMAGGKTIVAEVPPLREA